MMKLKAFTLAELLIALAILGVIATFTIPKVLTAQADQQKKSIFREAIATLNDIQYQWYLEGNQYTTHSAYFTYVLGKINAVKICPASIITQGCATSGPSSPGFRLANGAIITMGGSSAFDYTIDWNAEQLPNTNGDDILVVFGNKDNTSWCGLKPNIVSFPNNSCSGNWPQYNSWKTLYEWVFQ